MSLGTRTIGQILAIKALEEKGIDVTGLSPAEINEILASKGMGDAGLSIDKHEALFLIALFKLSKTPEGLKVIQNLGGKFIDGLFSAQKAMCATAAGNDISAWAAPVLNSAIFERFGMVPPGFNSQFHLGLSMIAGAEFIEDITSAITGIFHFAKTEKSENIQSITYTEATKITEVK